MKRPYLKPHKCDIFKNFYRTPSLLESHKTVHTGEKPFKCDKCDKRFRYKNFLANHNMIHTGEKPFKWNECDAKFRQKIHLVFHRRMHTGEMPFKCDICNKRFSRPNNLKRHKFTHMEKSAYECDICYKVFPYEQIMKEHKILHVNGNFEIKERTSQYQCNICALVFPKTYNLKRHKLVHTSEKPYQCQKCPNVYAQKRNIRYHLIKFHKVVPDKVDFSITYRLKEDNKTTSLFICGICDKTFTDSDLYTIHVWSHCPDNVEVVLTKHQIDWDNYKNVDTYTSDNINIDYHEPLNEQHLSNLIIMNSGKVPKVKLKNCNVDFSGTSLYNNSAQSEALEYSKVNFCSDFVCGEDNVIENTLELVVNIDSDQDYDDKSTKHVINCNTDTPTIFIGNEDEKFYSKKDVDLNLYNNKDLTDEDHQAIELKIEVDLEIKTENVDSSIFTVSNCDRNLSSMMDDSYFSKNDEKEFKVKIDSTLFNQDNIKEVGNVLEKVDATSLKVYENFLKEKCRTNDVQRAKNNQKNAEHENIAIDSQQLSCKLCNLQFSQKVDLLKHKISHLQKPYQQNNNQKESIDAVINNEINQDIRNRFKCPLQGCQLLQNLSDLKNGAGASHMIQIHNIYPGKMIKLGVKWKQI